MSATTTIRVSTQTRRLLCELAQTIGLPIQKVIEQAVEQYHRQYLLKSANAAYAQLREDDSAWTAYQEEQSEWDATMNDGLEGLLRNGR